MEQSKCDMQLISGSRARAAAKAACSNLGPMVADICSTRLCCRASIPDTCSEHPEVGADPATATTEAGKWYSMQLCALSDLAGLHPVYCGPAAACSMWLSGPTSFPDLLTCRGQQRC